MEIPPWFLTISGWAYSVLVLACVLVALVRKREAAQALAWSLAIVFIPFIGVLAFLVIGNRKIDRGLARKISHRAAFDDPGEHPEAGARSRIGYPDTVWGVLGRMMERIGQPPRRSGNTTRLFTQGVAAFDAMGDAIRAASHHIHIEFYIFRNDSFGRHLVKLLCAKASAGVEVRVIVDGLGSLGLGAPRRALTRCGGEVASFLPLFGGARLVSPNLRNHRKIVVCDGRIAFFGGLNIGREYLGRRRNRGRPWADLHMSVAGPAVWDLQRMFVEDWDFASGKTLEGEEYFPPLAVDGGDTGTPMQIIAGGPDLRPNPVREALLAALMRAQRRVLVATPYLVPDLGLRDVMMVAARAGVEVTVLMQYPPPDHWPSFLCGLYYAGELEAAGVRIHGYPDGVMHAKAVVVDGEWAMVGSANLDNRSLFLNFELMALFDAGPQPAAIEAAIDALLARAIHLDAAWIAARPWYQRMLIRPARLLAPLL